MSGKNNGNSAGRYPWVWVEIAMFMDMRELDRLFGERSQREHVYTVKWQRKEKRDDVVVHPLKHLAGLNDLIRPQRESDYILGKVLDESNEPRELPALPGGEIPVHPLKEIQLDSGELWFRFRVEKIAFGSKENFEKACNQLGIDPTSNPTQWTSADFYWIASDKKACLWCYNDPRDAEDFYPRYFELTGLRERIIHTADSNDCWNDISGLGRMNVWQDAPW